MRRLYFIFFITIYCLMPIWGQTKEMLSSKDSLLLRLDSLLQDTNDRIRKIHFDLSSNQRYKLYQTENIYNLLQLDTRTGMIDQVQWSLDSDKEFVRPINSEDLNYGINLGAGCFELYPTKNMYQFILLNKLDGRKWHVQWGLENSKRWIRRID